jgi:glutamyl-tRNA reductase
MTAAELFIVGASHRSAPLGVREQFAIPQPRWPEALADLAKRRLAREAALVSTCNRTEIYCRALDPAPVRAWLAARDAAQAVEGGVNDHPHLYTLAADDAVRHLFRVTCGLDSMIVGEPQIAGQMKRALEAASRAGTAHLILRRLFEHSFAAAKKVRSQTALSRRSLSFAALAVKSAKEIFPDIADLSALFVGGGEMTALGVAHFHGQGLRKIAVAGRTPARTRQLANRAGGAALSLEDIHDAAFEFDIIFAAAAGGLPVIGKGMIERALKIRRRRPMLIVDLGVPRNAEPEIAEVDGAFLCTLDTLGERARDGLAARAAAKSAAEEIVNDGAKRFLQWLDSRARAGAVSRLRDFAEAARRGEIKRMENAIAAGANPQDAAAEMSRRLANKILHPSTVALARDEQIAAAFTAAIGEEETP